MNTVDFWYRVNQLIKSKNTTQAGLSLDCGFNQRRIQNLSASSRAPDVFEAYKIAQALGVSVEYLVTGEDSNPAAETLDKIKNLLDDMKKIIDTHS